MNETSSASGRRILVVEDETLNALYVSSVLEALGHQVRCTETIERAMELAGSWRPHLALLDISLRDRNEDGIELARQLRARYGTPIIYATAHADARTWSRAQIADPVGYLIKPFSSKELGDAVAKAFALTHLSEAVA